jgi:hypothetical protein
MCSSAVMARHGMQVKIDSRTGGVSANIILPKHGSAY